MHQPRQLKSIQAAAQPLISSSSSSSSSTPLITSQLDIPPLNELQALFTKLNNRKTHIDKLNEALNQQQQHPTQKLKLIQTTTTTTRLKIKNHHHHHPSPNKRKRLSLTESEPITTTPNNTQPPLPKLPPPPLPPSQPPPLPTLFPPLPPIPPPPLPPTQHHLLPSPPPSSSSVNPSQLSPHPSSPVAPLVSSTSPTSTYKPEPIVKTEPIDDHHQLSPTRPPPPSLPEPSLSPDSQPLALVAPPPPPPPSLPQSNNTSLAPENPLESSSFFVSPSPPHPKPKDQETQPPRRAALPRLVFGRTTSQTPGTQPNGSISTPKSTISHSLPLPQCSNSATATLNKQAARSQTPLGTERAEDFSLPPDPIYSLPPLPTISVPMGYPKTQGEVNQDFSKIKPPSNQVPIHQFQNWINDNYLRSFGEDDLAFLASEYSSINGCPIVRVHVPTTNSTTTTTTTTTTAATSTTVPAVAAVASTPNSTHEGSPATTTKHGEVDDKSEDMTYVIPPLGRHYSEVWRDEDQGLSGSLKPHLERGLRPDLETRVPRLSHTDLDADALVSEKVHLGPLTERLISAIHPRSTCPSSSGSPLPCTANDTLAGSSVLPKLDLVDNVELESRVTNELKLLGVIGEEETMDWTTRSDDEISLALRRTQSVLAQQSGRNRLRKGVLSRLVKRRMAVQEFEAIKDGLERLLVQQMAKKNQLASLVNGARKSGSAAGHHPSANNTTTHNSLSSSDVETHISKMRALDADIHRTLLKRHAFLARLRPLLLASDDNDHPSSDASSAQHQPPLGAPAPAPAAVDHHPLHLLFPPSVSIYPDFSAPQHLPII